MSRLGRSVRVEDSDCNSEGASWREEFGSDASIAVDVLRADQKLQVQVTWRAEDVSMRYTPAFACFVATLNLGQWDRSGAFQLPDVCNGWRQHGWGRPLIRPTRSPESHVALQTAFGHCATVRPSQLLKQKAQRRRWTSQQSASSECTSSPSALRDRLGLEDRFGRWRFLQRLLDGEVSARDANELLVAVLQKSLTASQTREKIEGNVELSTEQRNRLQTFLDRTDDVELSAFEEGQLVLDPSMADQLNALLPSMDSDEDAYKGLWDTVIEIHGREAVKIDEAGRSPTWTACCLAARLLIHYDFLSEGI